MLRSCQMTAYWIVWDVRKEKRADHNNFGDCELAWTNIKTKSQLGVYRYLWSGLLREGDRKDELKARVHPTQKPVGLMVDIINDYSKPNDIVLDLFLVLGATLIACHKTNRSCYGIELDPKWVDVIIQRWVDFTGKQKHQEKWGKDLMVAEKTKEVAKSITQEMSQLRFKT